MSVLGLFVNALLFAVSVLLTRRLSTAIGLHMAWNLFQGLVFGFPVSGGPGYADRSRNRVHDD